MIPSGVTVDVANGEISVKGPKVTIKGQVPEGIEAMLAKPWYLWDREYVKGGARDVTCTDDQVACAA